MTFQSLLTSETLILLEVVFIGVLLLFFLINKDFTNGIYLWLLSLLFFRYTRLDMTHSASPDLSIDRILFVFLIAIFILEVLMKKRRLLPLTGIEYSMFLLCLLAVVSMVWAAHIVKEGGRLNIGELLPVYIFPFSMFFISQNVYDTLEKRERFIKFIMLIGIYLGITAIFEHFKMSEFIWPKHIADPNFGIHFGRARGPFGMAAQNGIVLGFVLMACFYFLFNSERAFLRRFFSFILLGLSPVAIFFTYTRGPWVGSLLGFAVLVILLYRHRKKIFILTAILLCIVGLISFFFLLDENAAAAAVQRTGATNPIYDRLNLYVVYINMFLHHPLFGVGFGEFAKYAPAYYVNINGITFQNECLSIHDTFGGILAEMGLVGMTLILSVYFLIISKSIRLYRRLVLHGEAGKYLVFIFWGFITVYLVSSLFTGMRYCGFANCLFFIFAGIICGWERRCHEEVT